MNSYLTYAVIQSGYCVFGAGVTPEQAYEDAAQWLGPRKPDNEPYTAEMVEDECDNFQFVGDLVLIYRDNDPEEFDSYMRDQGCYRFDGAGWAHE